MMFFILPIPIGVKYKNDGNYFYICNHSKKFEFCIFKFAYHLQNSNAENAIIYCLTY